MTRSVLPAILRKSALALIAFGLACAAFAQAYPTKPIRIVIPFPPGDTTDILTRLIAPRLSERMGQPVIVENRPGVSGTLGMGYVARSAPDGYTIAAGQGGTLTVLPNTTKNIPYDALKDFVPIAASIAGYMGIVAHPDAPFKTLAEMIAYAKANPGRLTVATNGAGGFPHLNFERLRMMADFSFIHVPYRGAGAFTTDIIGGQVMVGVGATPGLVPHMRTGRLRLLAVTSKTRLPFLPDTPVVAETVPGYEVGGWFGYVAPAGTPRGIVLRLNDEINRAVNLPEIAEKLVTAGLIVAAEPPEFFGDIIKSEHAKYARLVRDIGFQPQ